MKLYFREPFVRLIKFCRRHLANPFERDECRLQDLTRLAEQKRAAVGVKKVVRALTLPDKMRVSRGI